jgi:general secretion pathway protein K
MKRDAAHRTERGFALLIVLWTISILALLLTTLLANARQEARLTTTLRAEAVDRAAADAVLSEMILDVLRPSPIPRGLWRFGAVNVSVRLEDLSGRMNPNIASPMMLEALLARLGVPPQAAQTLAAAIVDWRTPGQKLTPHGAKAPDYRAAGLTYGPPGRPFENLDEIGFVLGMTPAVLVALKPHLTLWATSDPDPAFADGVVLTALRAAGVPPVAGNSNIARVIAMTAVASQPDAPRVVRRAVVRFGYSPDGRWRILAWDDAEDEAE